jgi:hypothetical protein
MARAMLAVLLVAVGLVLLVLTAAVQVLLVL